MKLKIFASTIIFMIFLMGTISAFEFDNVGSYDEKTKTMTVKNCDLWLLTCLNEGEDIAEVKLLSPLDNHVPLGYGEVARFQVTQYSDYENALKEVELFNKRDGDKEFQRDYDLKVLTRETKEYEIVGTDWDGKPTTHYENKTIDVWTNLTLSDFKTDDVLTIGIFTEVKLGDKVEWIPNIMGIRIDEWAVWTEDLNVGLNHYYELSDANDSLGITNLSIVGSPVFGAGLILDGINLSEGENPGNYLTTSTDWGINGSTSAVCLNAWVNVTNTPQANENVIMGSKSDTTDVLYYIAYRGTPNELEFHRTRFNEGTERIEVAITLAVDDVYHMITGCDDKVNLMLYLDGVLIGSSASSVLNGTGSNPTLSRIGENPQTADSDFDGKIDEAGVWVRNLTLAEIVQLNNSGLGITYTTIFTPSVTLNSPAAFLNTSNASITFNATIGTLNPDNVTLFIDDSGNETNTTGIQDDYIFPKEIAEGVHTWNIQACNSDGCINGTERTFTIDQSSPTLNITFPTETINFHIVNNNLSVNWTVSDLSLDTCILQFEGVNRTVTCNDNQTQINITNSINRTIIFFVNDTFGNTNSSSRTWSYLAFQHEIFFNASVFETSSQTFTINISANSTPSSASLIYGGTIFSSATVTSNSNFFNISRSINIPTSIGAKSFRFNFSVNSTEINTNSKNQTVSAINLTLCGAAPQNVPYINITFKNETVNEESLNATIISTWRYSLSSVGTINKTLSFSNSSENLLYSFCFNPPNRTVNIDSTINYNNAQSQQRTFSLITALTNLTTSQVLYLLPTSLGLFSPFQVVDNIGNPISTARGLITRILGASTITVTSAFTDDSGFVTYFLNPEVTYTGSFSKSGFTTETFSFTPTSDTRTVILGGGTGVIGNGTSILTNTTYTITPSNRTLTNSTNYLFSFNVSSSQAITFISMNITSNGTSHLFVSNAGQGFISGIVNTGENSSFVGYFVMKTAEETFSLASIWIIDQTFIGDYSLFKQMVLFNEYEFTDFIRLLITLCFIIGIMIFINNIGISDDSESKIAIALLLVWAFSIVGWLDTGIISSSGSSNIQSLAQFSNQFGIAILSTGAGAYFILRRVFT